MPRAAASYIVLKMSERYHVVRLASWPACHQNGPMILFHLLLTFHFSHALQV